MNNETFYLFRHVFVDLFIVKEKFRAIQLTSKVFQYFCTPDLVYGSDLKTYLLMRW